MATNFEIVSDKLGEPLVIRDVGPWDVFATVTNEVEDVVRKLWWADLLRGQRRLLYFDSHGELDQILFDDGGKFLAFAPLSEEQRAPYLDLKPKSKTRQKFYLGDSVYVDFDGHHVVLTTENGISVSNEIYLDQSVYDALVKYVERLKAAP